MEASETTTPTETPAAPEQDNNAYSGWDPIEPTPDTPATPDLGEQVAALSQEIQTLRGQIPEQQGEPDLYYQLADGELGGGDQGYGPEYDYEYGPEEGLVDPFDAIIRERVAEAIGPIHESIERDRRSAQLNQLADSHPELWERDYQEAITDRLAPLAERYGNELILTDPELVEQALILEKAARTTAQEVPAEQAVNQGARLESAAGATSLEAEPSIEEQIKRGILGAGGSRDAFT